MSRGLDEHGNVLPKWLRGVAFDPGQALPGHGDVKPEQLDLFSVPRPEHIDRAGERIGAPALANERCQAPCALPEVDRLRPLHDEDRRLGQ